MAEIEPLLADRVAGEQPPDGSSTVTKRNKAARLASLDVFRGLSVFLMMLVDYAGSIFPIIAHAPWTGIHLADLVMPFFLFVAGVSVAIAYKKVSDRVKATQKALLRALKLFLLGVLLQGGFFHGVSSLTYGVDVEKIRMLGVLQRIAIGYVVAVLCEIWLPQQMRRGGHLSRNYTWQWCVALLISVLYLGFLYGLYVPDWQYTLQSDTPMATANNSHIYMVKCCVRGDLGPACNSAGMIDRYILGVDHLYAKPAYRNLKECNISSHGQVPETSPSWCHTPFDPEGILSSLTAAVACIVGLQYGHILIQLQLHKERLQNWSIYSVSLMGFGLLLCLLGMPLNKSIYTVSYMMVTTASAGITFCVLYMLVDVYEWRRSTFVLEWMGKHSLSIFVLVTSNVVVIATQGFYLETPRNNIVIVDPVLNSHSHEGGHLANLNYSFCLLYDFGIGELDHNSGGAKIIGGMGPTLKLECH